MTTRKFPARLDLLHQMLGWILKSIECAGFEKNDLRKIEIASEEALVNIINHAYQGKVDKIIQINIKVSKDSIELKFLDTGPQFNPVIERDKTDQNISLEDMPLGGLGLVLIRQYMDNIAYERKGSTNIFTLTKHISY